MNDFESEAKPSSKLTILWIILLGLVATFVAAIMAGYLIAHFSQDGATFSLLTAAISLAGMTITGFCIYFALRLDRRRSHNMGPIPRKEKLYRNYVIVMVIIGILLGRVWSAYGRNQLQGNYWSMLSNDPIPASLAIIISVTLVIVLPLISYFWHTRAIDEQENQAVGKAAIIGIYFYMMAAPAWWFLWRGGIMPEYNGIIIYLLTNLIVSFFWLKNKYF